MAKMKVNVLLSSVLAVTIARSCCLQLANVTSTAANDSHFSQYTFNSDFHPLNHRKEVMKPMKHMKHMKHILSGPENALATEVFHHDSPYAFGNYSFSNFSGVPLPSNVLDLISEFRVLNQNEEIVRNLFLKLLSSHKKISSSDAHRKLITKSLFKISQGLELFGLINSCSVSAEAHTYQLITDALETFLLRRDASRGQNSTSEHPLNRILNFVHDAQGKQSHCEYRVRENENHKLTMEEFVRLIDPDVAEYMSSKIFPLQSVLSKTMDNATLFSSGAKYICDILDKTSGQYFDSCKSSVLQIVEFLKSSLSYETNGKIRRKRWALKPNPLEDVKRNGYDGYGQYSGRYRLQGGGYHNDGYHSDGYHSDGYHGDGYHGYGEYEEDSIIIVPDEDESGYKHIYLIKVLAAWAFGAYCLLGLLAYQTFFNSAFGYGPPGFGLKGRPGPIGDKGFKGMKGMLGNKGMPGDVVPGDPGDPGDKGMKGDKGPPGMKGPMGPQGPKGAAGPQGTPGDPGVDNDSPAPNGPKGVKGSPGAMGGMGVQGPGGKRRRRDVEHILRENNVKTIDLTDSAGLLSLLYDGKDNPNRGSSPKKKHIILAETLNGLWRDFKDPYGCLKCSLFDRLSSSDTANIDSYIVAGFAHLLGEASSLQLLDQVRKAKAKGFSLHCKRKKRTCTLGYSADVTAGVL